MSDFNIPRFVEIALKERTSVYSPLIEAIVNSIEAISETNRTDGEIIITPKRSPQISLETNELPDIVGFTVEDNGIGFNGKNRDAFDTLCTDYKAKLGGKGLGRFIFLKYFKKVKISSVYESNGTYRLREFNLGSKRKIVDDEADKKIEASDTKTTLFLEELKRFEYDKTLDTIARKLLERILVFFVNEDMKCPEILLRENNDTVVLNDLLKDSSEIQQVHSDKFSIKHQDSGNEHEFQIKVYKIVYPGNVTSKICLTAHNRQVTETPIYKHIPEFKGDFHEQDDDNE